MLSTTEAKYQEYFEYNKNAIAERIKDNYSNYCNFNINSKFLGGDKIDSVGFIYLSLAVLSVACCEYIISKIIVSIILIGFLLWSIHVINERYKFFRYRIYLIFLVPLVVEAYVKEDKNYSPDDYFYKMCIDYLTYYFQNAAYLWDKIEKE